MNKKMNEMKDRLENMDDKISDLNNMIKLNLSSKNENE
jgi:hypothetical protein